MRIIHSQTAMAGFLPDPASDTLPSSAVNGVRNLKPTPRGWEKTQGFKASNLKPVNDRRYIMYWAQEEDKVKWFVAGTSITEVTDSGTLNVGRNSGYESAGRNLWQGVNFIGTPLMNNELDSPQYFQADKDKFADLPGLPVDTRFRYVGCYKNYIIGLGVTEVVNNKERIYDSEIYWSDSSDAGYVPDNWSIDDPASDSGRVPLVSDGFLIACLEMGDVNIVYKSDSIWMMQWVGGNEVFSFEKRFEAQGILNKRSVVEFDRKHFVVTRNDIIVHDGTQIQSVADKKFRRYFFEDLNHDHYDRVFVVKNMEASEIVVFYPDKTRTDGSCNKALVYDWQKGSVHIYDSPNIWSAASGLVVGNGGEFQPKIHYSLVGSATIVIPSTDGRVLGEAITSVWQRDNIMLGRISRDGVPQQDYTHQKTLNKISFDVESSGWFDVYIRCKNDLNDVVDWEYVGQFDPKEGKDIAVLYTATFFDLKLMTTHKHFVLRNVELNFEFAGDSW